MSQLVAALEKDLGLTLLVRSKKGVKVTSEGAKLAPIVRSYLAREKEMYELASEMQGISMTTLLTWAFLPTQSRWTTSGLLFRRKPSSRSCPRMGLGISFVNELSAQYWNDHLVKLPLDPPQKVEFGIAYTSKEHMTAAAKKFYDYAIQCIKGE